ncbi:diguanylate cyclase [Paucimonas lemoignei]|nr:diguanylate cyclase [Paucimonas lemoignei]
MMSWLRSTQEEITKVQESSHTLENLLSLMKDVETGQRGFIITGKEAFLEPYYAAQSQIADAKAELSALSRNSGQQLQAHERIRKLVDLRVEEATNNIELRRADGFAAAEPAVTRATGKAYMDELRQLIGQELEFNQQHIQLLVKELGQRNRIATNTELIVTLVNFVLLSLVFIFMFRLLRERQATATQLQKTGEERALGMTALEHRNQEISTISQMAQALDSTQSVKETFEVIALYCAKLLPQTSGTLYLFRNSRDLLEMEAQWGTSTCSRQTIEPAQCWGLRRGQPHHTSNTQDLCCAHYDISADAKRHFCIPLSARGEVLGLMYIESPPSTQEEADRLEMLAIAVSEQISLAVANARLREVLRQQSIIDPLTGLYNRRYLDETLKRELARAVRHNKPIALIELDIDHFKKVNDTYGHDAGDLVLSLVSSELKAGIRESDLACRFGGEELVVILPECNREAALERAEKLRQAISRLDILHNGQHIGNVTASFGVAAYPEHGSEPEHLFRCADQALYSAKRNGRNRVEVAG